MEYLAGHASWGVWRIWRCGLKWERKRISHIGQITFILGAEGLYQEIFTASKLLHLKAKQHELQDSGACGMHVARVNGMWQICIWGCGMSWSCAVSLPVCGMLQSMSRWMRTMLACVPSWKLAAYHIPSSTSYRQQLFDCIPSSWEDARRTLVNVDKAAPSNSSDKN